MFITFEGIDGSGKTTQIQLLEEELKKQGFKVEVFREPGGTVISEEIRELLLNEKKDIRPIAEMLLFSSARAQLTAEKILPLLAQKKVVILDRFYDSTIAYQGYGRQLMDVNDIEIVSRIATQGLTPDITFYLKISVTEAQKRTNNLSSDRMEQSGTAFYERVIQGYDMLAQKYERIKTLDSTCEVSKTHTHIIKILKPFLFKQ